MQEYRSKGQLMRMPLSLPTPDSRMYCWVIVFAGILILFACLGIGRFSFGMMLPAMGAGLELSYAQMGFVSTVNFCGYLGAVLLCGRLTSLLGARVLIFLALLLVGFSMVLVGCTTLYWWIVVLYCLTGVGSALANVPMMALISTWFDPSRRGRAAGLCVMGNGFGLLFSGKAVPLLNGMGDGWSVSWLVLGGVVLIIAMLSFMFIRNRPSPEFAPVGMAERSRESAATEAPGSGLNRCIIHCAGIYFLFGFSYVIYITFMVTSLVEERGMSEAAAGSLWSWVGFLSLGSGPLLGYLSDRYSRKSALVLVFAIQATAYLLVAMKLPTASVYVSIICFAIVAWSVPSIMAALVGDFVGPLSAAAAFGFVTFAFGIGQIAGPALAGMLAEWTGSFSLSFFLASFLAIIAVVFSSLLPGKK